MLHTILFILKIIGIILAVVLGLILLLIIFILFVPVRYKGIIDRKKDQKLFKAQVKVTWLLHIITLKVEYIDGQLTQCLRVFGLNITKLKKKLDERKNKKEQITKKKRQAKEENVVMLSFDVESNSIKEENVNSHGKTQILIESNTENSDIISEVISEATLDESSISTNINDENEDSSLKITNKADNIDNKESKKSLFNKIKDFAQSTYNFVANIKKVLCKVIDKIKHILKNIENYSDLVTDDRNQKTIKFIFSKVRKLIKHIMPRKIKGNIYFGSEDPSTTGKILAILSILYGIYGKHINIYPAYDESYFYGDIYLRGRVRIAVVLKCAWKLYFDKEVKRLIQTVKKEK